MSVRVDAAVHASLRPDGGDKKPTVLCLMGPTGSGKTALALALAECLPVEIVSVDSAMIYRQMDIGTDKPSREIREQVPHHLIDICDPAERYSAGAFARDATRAIQAIIARGRVPVLAGGTFLYFRALTMGFAPMPPADAATREAIHAEASEKGWEAMHAQLARIDPAIASRIAPMDRQRVERALELARLSGRPPSQLHSAKARGAPFRFLRFALWPEDRGALARRLEARFDTMLQRGLIEEVRALHARDDLDFSSPAVRAVGYRQLWQWLEGTCGLEEARRRAVVATRRYAKRQLTWLRSETHVVRLPIREVPPLSALSPILEALREASELTGPVIR